MITIERLMMIFNAARTKMEKAFPYYLRTERIQGMIDMIGILENAVLECINELKEDEKGKEFRIW